MNAEVEYLFNKASSKEVAEHLSCCDADFIPPLSARVEISDYANKITSRAMRFEAWSGGKLVGLVAVYCNDQETRIAYITSVSLLKSWTDKGVATKLMKQCVKYAKTSAMLQIRLEVAIVNLRAIKLYEKNGFISKKGNGEFVAMYLFLCGGRKNIPFLK